jgi:hypothetical protein
MVAIRLAELRQESINHIAKITTQNAKKLINQKDYTEADMGGRLRP